MTLATSKNRRRRKAGSRYAGASVVLRTEPLEDRLLPSLTPRPLLDINPGGASSDPSGFTQVNNLTFFRAADEHGAELWGSDGSAAGTYLVKDINPGPVGSIPSSLTNVTGTLFFAANDGTNGNELWESNGTDSGTFLLKDINPGAGSSNPRYLTNVNGTLFFAADDGTDGTELWESNGTSAGTLLVKDINPGPNGSALEELTNVNGTLFFGANDGTHGNGLWRSDGTNSGTFMVKDISYPAFLANVNGKLFFQANDGLNGAVWASDGSAAGTVLVHDFAFTPGDTSPRYLTNVNGTLFFAANDGTHGYQLWASNGSAAGTFLVKDIPPPEIAPFGGLTNVNGTLFFTPFDGTHGSELWRSNGTDAGTFLVKDINPGAGGSYPFYLTNVSGSVFFSADDGTDGRELWASDGSNAGTSLVAGSSSPQYLTNGNGALFFSANDGTEGVEPWIAPVSTTSTTTLSSSPSPSLFSQTVIFTATIREAPGSAPPTGTVDFTEGITDLTPGGVTLSGNQAMFSTSALAVGTHTITAIFSGDNNFAGSKGDDSASPQIVAQGDSSTFFASIPGASVFGQPVTFIAFVSAVSPAAGVPSGTVNFFADHTVLADVSLSNGFASFSTSALAVGIHRIGAIYNGDSNFQASIAAIPGDTVSQDGTTTALSAPNNPSVFGQPAIFTATVSPLAPGSGTPTGTVDFKDGSTDLTPGGVSLSGNQATFSTSALAVGSHTITALYSGDGNFIGSQGDDSASPQVVENASSATSLVSVSGASVFGEPAAFVAFVTPVAPATGTPTGTVTFMEGTTTLAANVSLSGGHAGFHTTSLTVGSHTITAVYSGNASLMGSSNSATQVVSKAATSTGLTSSQNPSVFGQAVVFTATVLASAPGSGTPTGTMDFKEGATDLTPGGVSLTAGGRATFSTSSLSIGQHTLTASYGGDAKFTASQRAAPQVVNKAPTRMPGLAAFPNPAVFGQVISFTASVLALFPGKGTPTGMATFLDGSTTLGSLTLTGGRATFTTASLTRGNHAISATYSGDSAFLPSAAAAYGEPVQKDATTAAVTSSANPAVVGTVVTFTAVVQASVPGSGKPTGTVTFTDITTVLGTGTLNGAGQTTFSTSALIVGIHAITANYAGDNNFTSSFSPVLAETVKTMALKSPVTADQLAVPFPAGDAPSLITNATSNPFNILVGTLAAPLLAQPLASAPPGPTEPRYQPARASSIASAQDSSQQPVPGTLGAKAGARPGPRIRPTAGSTLDLLDNYFAWASEFSKWQRFELLAAS
jgi:ELWxxDGT repeat protein